MWNEPIPTWRTARKQHQCHGEGCTNVIPPGEQYLDKLLLQPQHSHLRYCRACGEPIMLGSDSYRLIRRNSFPDRYQERISSEPWKSLRREIIEKRGNRCERCGSEGNSLALHHVHYRSLGNEQPEDVELLCSACHTEADKSRARQNSRLSTKVPRKD